MGQPGIAGSTAPAPNEDSLAIARGNARRERWLSMIGLGGVAAAFAVFAAQAVHRSVNSVWGDIAFSGWTAAIAHRLVAGERIYTDFVLPLPPGSFAVLAFIERWMGGGPSMLAESAVCAACCVALSWCAYGIVQPAVGRRAALYTAAGSLAWICGWSKELAYDYLAEVTAYGGIWLLVLSLIADDDRRARRLSFFVGLAVGATLLFKQSTAIGLFGAALAGLAYTAFVERREPSAPLRLATQAIAVGAGAAAGFAVCVATVVALGGSVSTFLGVVFVDGPALKGGTGFLVHKTATGLALGPVAILSLAQIIVVLAIAHRAFWRGLGDTGARGQAGRPFGALDVGMVAGLFGAGFLFAATLLAGGRRTVPAALLWLGRFSFSVVHPAVVLAVVLFFVNLRAPRAARAAHGFNVAAVSTLTLACAVSGSLVTFQPLDEANATIAVVLAALFFMLERAGLRLLSPVALALLVAGPLSSRVQRCLRTKTPASLPFWRGLSVGEGGTEVLRAARRVRALAGEHDDVLVLPEDPVLVALIGRPRPKLCGAIIFADQYPERCLDHDLWYLAKNAPRVVVTHPTPPEEWVPIFRLWNTDGPAERLTRDFVTTHLGAYEHDSVYVTPWGVDDRTTLDVWVRR